MKHIATFVWKLKGYLVKTQVDSTYIKLNQFWFTNVSTATPLWHTIIVATYVVREVKSQVPATWNDYSLRAIIHSWNSQTVMKIKQIRFFNLQCQSRFKHATPLVRILCTLCTGIWTRNCEKTNNIQICRWSLFLLLIFYID